MSDPKEATETGHQKIVDLLSPLGAPKVKRLVVCGVKTCWPCAVRKMAWRMYGKVKVNVVPEVEMEKIPPLPDLVIQIQLMLLVLFEFVRR